MIEYKYMYTTNLYIIMHIIRIRTDDQSNRDRVASFCLRSQCGLRRTVDPPGSIHPTSAPSAVFLLQVPSRSTSGDGSFHPNTPDLCISYTAV